MARPRKTDKFSAYLGAVAFWACLVLPFLSSGGVNAQQEPDLQISLDINSNTVPLPKIFRPNIDLGGRGFHRESSWPQEMAAKEALKTWRNNIGFNGIFRIQYNLWEINQLAKDKAQQDKLLANYEDLIKSVSDSGGTVILDIFGTPAGLGKVLDKKSAPCDPQAFKELIKSQIRHLSCDKKYNVWYEVWNAPDLDEFFLGKKADYLALYRIIAQAVGELEAEAKVSIPLGGPGASWWFQNVNGNTILTPEESLIYEFIQFCYRNHLPLDFISWHGYSSDPKIDQEATPYKKNIASLIRDWLSYFRFDRNIPLIIDEWNYDRYANVLPERKENASVAASYIPSRLKGMYEAGIDYQLYFSLEDFQNNQEGVVRNTGVFWFDSEFSEYKGAPKCIYNVFRMLHALGDKMFVSSGPGDEFVGTLATRGKDYIAVLIYNYLDPQIANNYLSRNLSELNGSEIKSILDLIQYNRLDKLLEHQLDPASLRVSKRVAGLVNKAQELNSRYVALKASVRNLRLEIKNLEAGYLYSRYSVDSSCSLDCGFSPVETKELQSPGVYQETLMLNPYSVNLIVLQEKPPQPPQVEASAQAVVEPSAQQGLSGNNSSS